MNKLKPVRSVLAPNSITLNYLLWKQKFIDNFQIKPYKGNSAVPVTRLCYESLKRPWSIFC